MPDSLETAQHFIFVTQIYFCSMYAVVLWDWVISLPREWRFIWLTHWTPVKMAYLFCRYWVMAVVPYLLFCFVVDHSQATCAKIFNIPVALALWNQVGSEVILLIRTYAFFNRNPLLLAFLIAAMAGVVAYQLYVATSQMQLLPFVKPPFDRGPCFPASKPHSKHLLGFFIAPLLFDTIVTTITVLKAFNIRRRSGGPSSRLIQTFLREGVFYYILISIANLINGIFYLQPRQVISAINIPLSVMLGPVLACRLILDLRERGSETVSHSEGTGIAAFTTKSNNSGVTGNDSINGSPYTSAQRLKHDRSFGRTHPRNGPRPTSTIGSNVLTSVGSILPELDQASDLEMNDMGVGFGRKESMKTVRGEGSSREGSEVMSPAPAYNSLEMGFNLPQLQASTLNGVRVDVEKTTSSI
ncbi:hypothetical protein PILCRDRAFT_785956 [Piloderma croceum F 1598]|uniref:DUF6533 domain-containing protein n=1 Tax=Piloderma croceum (strain F 1598) TaxID=765440 RepID=A0A0C3FRJ0_PILCF|nr:hypothetical protein PILCRDRAFT_785956 [Piloderma croceum F 1598]